MRSKRFDVSIIGGGIIGTATAMALTGGNNISLVVLEAEDSLATHQTGHNSGVIHSGLYYRPNSLKALNCVEGRKKLYKFCEIYDIPYEKCGKIVVATSDDEIPYLEKLYNRGLANGLLGLKKLTGEEIKEYEPYVEGVAGLFVPETGIVDYAEVARKYAEISQENGGEIWTGARVTKILMYPGEIVIETTKGALRTRTLINCAGLQADRIAKMCGLNPNLRIIPFRGEYCELVPERRSLVKNLIYPVPDPGFPFLGVHFTRRIDGRVEAGPNAVLVFKREGYKKLSFSIRDFSDIVFYKGFWKLSLKHWRIGMMELVRSFSKRAFVRSLQKLIPVIATEDVRRAGAGVRAQALEPDGSLVDDFRIVQTSSMIHVLNAPSPAATASISIGQTIARLAGELFNFH